MTLCRFSRLSSQKEVRIQIIQMVLLMAVGMEWLVVMNTLLLVDYNCTPTQSVNGQFVGKTVTRGIPPLNFDLCDLFGASNCASTVFQLLRFICQEKKQLPLYGYGSQDRYIAMKAISFYTCLKGALEILGSGKLFLQGMVVSQECNLEIYKPETKTNEELNILTLP